MSELYCGCVAVSGEAPGPEGSTGGVVTQYFGGCALGQNDLTAEQANDLIYNTQSLFLTPSFQTLGVAEKIVPTENVALTSLKETLPGKYGTCHGTPPNDTNYAEINAPGGGKFYFYDTNN